MKYIGLLLLIYSFSSSSFSSVPSFNCNSSLGEMEEYICNNDKIAEIDVTLGRLYYSCMKTGFISDVKKKVIKQSQKKWINNRNQCSEKNTDTCLLEIYRGRIKKLRGYLENSPSNILFEEGNRLNDAGEQYKALDKYKRSYENSDNDSGKLQSLGGLLVISDKLGKKSDVYIYAEKILEIDKNNKLAKKIVKKNEIIAVNTSNKKKYLRVFHTHGKISHNHFLPVVGIKHRHLTGRDKSIGTPVETTPEELFSRGFDYQYEKKYSKAYDMFKKSAERGYKGAQYSLGKLYEDGLGVSMDKKKALYWYKKASNQGHSEAHNRIVLLNSKISNQHQIISHSSESDYTPPEKRTSKKAYTSSEKISICLALTWGPDVCGPKFIEFSKTLGTEVNDIVASPSCLTIISSALNEDVSQTDINYAAFTGALDEVGSSGIKSKDFWGILAGGLTYLYSYSLKLSLFHGCLENHRYK